MTQFTAVRRAVMSGVALFVVGMALAGNVSAESRFPQPEFDSGYVLPVEDYPAAGSPAREYLDVLVLLAALSAADYFLLKRRSRTGIVLVSVFSLAYFGFWRKGCICAVGSLQNVVLAVSGGDYAIPVTALAFFLIPLVFTLFFGRTFCGAVCPLGAAQDLVALRPKTLPYTLERVLGIIPFVYLGLAVLMAATGSSFLICRFDPFVGFFRRSGSTPMLLFGACILLLGVFVARPYCRFLCPYGVLLKWASWLSRRHMTITPDECIECRLCEDSCPFGAILKPAPDKYPEKRSVGMRRLFLLVCAVPVLVSAGIWGGRRFEVPLSQVNPTVVLAERMAAETAGQVEGTTLHSESFRSKGQPLKDLYAEALSIRARFRTGGMLLGGFIGLVVGLGLIGLSVRRGRKGYEPDKANCLSCGRCMEYCPVGREDRKERLREGDTDE